MELEEDVENTLTHQGSEVEECPRYLGDGKGCFTTHHLVVGRKVKVTATEPVSTGIKVIQICLGSSLLWTIIGGLD